MHTNRDARTFRKILKTIKHRINTATGLPIQHHFDRQVPTKSISGQLDHLKIQRRLKLMTMAKLAKMRRWRWGLVRIQKQERH